MTLTPEEKRISEYLYGFILGLLSQFDADTFRKMIQYNISPFDIDIQIDPYNANYISSIIKKYKHRIPEYLNYNFIMSRMKIKRPDLYGLFIEPEGKKALERWIQQLWDLLQKI